MSDILCIYYSRSGKTQKAVEEIAQSLDAETVRLRDAAERGGWRGWLRCGLDAVRKDTRPLSHFETERPLEAYRLIVLGTPVWAGRCSSVMRAFLKKYGPQLRQTAYVITRGGQNRCEEVYDQMDAYVPGGRIEAVSLRVDDVGCHFWEEDFVRRIRERLADAEA